MANTHSAEKRHRQSLKRQTKNTAVKSAVKTAVKKAREAMAKGDGVKAKEAVRAASVALDKAASKGVLHAKNASRRIGRLARGLTAKPKVAAAK